MNPDLVAALVRDFPTLFANATDRRERLAAFGTCECGDGWEPLIRRTCETLVKFPDVRLSCIKEKWGGLRIYCEGSAMVEAWDVLTAAEIESMSICETCGKPGTVRNTGWIRTCCDDHAPAPR